jgi:hypothetical protein
LSGEYLLEISAYVEALTEQSGNFLEFCYGNFGSQDINIFRDIGFGNEIIKI